MNAAAMMQSCPDPETLSAFIDQRLDPQSRLDVVNHLADCDDCREIVVMANEYSVENEVEGGKVVRGRWTVPLTAAAALVVVALGVTPIREQLFGRSAMPALIAAANNLPKRTTEARLSGDFAYKEHSVPRGGEENPEHAVELAALRAEERAAKNPNRANLHAAGVGLLLKKQSGEAVETLRRAAKDGTPSADLLNDLAAAYLARGRKGDAELALDAANRAWTLEQKPAAIWNRALALEVLERDQDAIAAWHEYLEVDPDSDWSKEVRTEHLSRLTGQ